MKSLQRRQVATYYRQLDEVATKSPGRHLLSTVRWSRIAMSPLTIHSYMKSPKIRQVTNYYRQLGEVATKSPGRHLLCTIK